MSAEKAKVSVVIPNRNGATPQDGLVYLELILHSLRGQTFRDFDVTVVDNGSTDGSVAYLRERWPEVRIVELGENTGFPTAVNRGIEASAGEYIALLNNDLELSPDWIERLVDELDGDPGLGFVTGKILRFAERDVVEQAGHDFYTCGLFAPRGLDEEDTGQYDLPAPTAIVSAAAAMYRREGVERVGSFDEDYFLYCEDADLCLRMLLAGYRGRYVPGPEAYHVRGGTAARDSEMTGFYLQRNGLITLAKDMPASILMRSLVRIAIYQYGQLVAAMRQGRARVLVRSYGSFLRMVPATLRKRRAVQRARRVAPAEFAAELRTEYPFPTRLGRLFR